MKATKIYYEKTFNLGNYQNEVIGIEIQPEEGETAKQIMDEAKKFVECQHNEYDKNAKEILENPENYSWKQVMEAKRRFDEATKDEFPF